MVVAQRQRDQPGVRAGVGWSKGDAAVLARTANRRPGLTAGALGLGCRSAKVINCWRLKCWRVLTCDFRGRPRQLTTIVKAVQALQYLIRDPFGTVGIGTAS